jgi:hypothetical protein
MAPAATRPATQQLAIEGFEQAQQCELPDPVSANVQRVLDRAATRIAISRGLTSIDNTNCAPKIVERMPERLDAVPSQVERGSAFGEAPP